MEWLQVQFCGSLFKHWVSNEDHLDQVNDPTPKAEGKGKLVQDLNVSLGARGGNVHGT